MYHSYLFRIKKIKHEFCLQVEKLLKNFNGLVVIDEAYIDFSTQESWLARLEEFPNLIVTQTLSKAYGMAGIRLGICYASKEIIQILNNIKPPYNINSLISLCEKWKQNLPLVTPYFAIKCLPQTPVLKTLAEYNFGFDCFVFVEQTYQHVQPVRNQQSDC